jgi:hypothetical protein
VSNQIEDKLGDHWNHHAQSLINSVAAKCALDPNDPRASEMLNDLVVNDDMEGVDPREASSIKATARKLLRVSSVTGRANALVRELSRSANLNPKEEDDNTHLRFMVGDVQFPGLTEPVAAAIRSQARRILVNDYNRGRASLGSLAYWARSAFWATLFVVAAIVIPVVAWARDQYSAAEWDSLIKALFLSRDGTEWRTIVSSLVVSWVAHFFAALWSDLGASRIRKHPYLLDLYFCSVANLVACLLFSTHFSGYLWGMGTSAVLLTFLTLRKHRRNRRLACA